MLVARPTLGKPARRPMLEGPVTAVEARSASEADVDALIVLNKVVQDLHVASYPRDFKAVVDQTGMPAWLTSRLHEPNSVIAVAELDASPVSYAWFELQARPETLFNPARRRIYLHHLSVVPGARCQGVATALLQFIEQRAAADGITDVMLDTWMANADARAFFAARDFAPLQTIFRKTLAAARSSVMTEGGIAGSLNHAIKQEARAA